MKVGSYIKNSLKSLGLTEGESDIYHEVWKSPGISVSGLKDRTGYSFAGVYKMTNALTDKKFLIVNKEAGGAIFTVVPLGDVAHRFLSQSRRMERISYKLKELSKLSRVPEACEVLEDSNLSDYYLNLPHRVDQLLWCIGSYEAVMKFVGPEVEREFVNTRVKRGKNAQAIMFDDSVGARALATRDVLERRETKFVKCSEYPLEFSYIFDNTYVNFYKADDGKIKIVKIDSPEFVKSKMVHYKSLWDSTPR